jgi:hypothetical protein
MDMKTYVTQITEHATRASRSDVTEFCNAMTQEHRTHQQSFTRLCVMWLNHIGQEEFLTDPRNEASHQVGAGFLTAVKMDIIDPYLPFL